MFIKGKAHKLGDNINTDDIIAAKYLISTDPKELGRHCLENINPDFVKQVNAGDIIVAGSNFGCGSSREHAPLAIKGCGISCVIAKTFARIFFRNAINIGLPILGSAEASDDAKEGEEFQIDLTAGEIKNLSRDKIYKSAPFPKFMQEIIDAGGLLKYLIPPQKSPRL